MSYFSWCLQNDNLCIERTELSSHYSGFSSISCALIGFLDPTFCSEQLDFWGKNKKRPVKVLLSSRIQEYSLS